MTTPARPIRHAALLGVLALLVAGVGLPAPAGASTTTSTTTSTTAAAASTPRPATVHDFVKAWGGHTRYIDIERNTDGELIGTEAVGDGCCHPIVDVTMRLTDVRGTRGRASMRAEVLTVTVHDPSDFTDMYPAPEVGDVKRIRIRRNVLHERLTGQIYCDPDSSLPWVCGA